MDARFTVVFPSRFSVRSMPDDTTPPELTHPLEWCLSGPHRVLRECGVTIGAVFVDGQLREHGYPVLARVRIALTRERVTGRPDAEITVASDGWLDLSDAERVALVDHELTHLQVAATRGGIVVWADRLVGVPRRDRAGRPILRLRRHDCVAEGFADVVARHGESAPLARALRRVRGRLGR